MPTKSIAVRLLSVTLIAASIAGAQPVSASTAGQEQPANATPTAAPAQPQQSGLRIFMPVAARDGIDFDFNPFPQRPNATPVPSATPFPAAAPGVTTTLTVIQEDGVSWVRVDGPGLVLSLKDIATAANAANLGLTGDPLLVEELPKIWRLGHNLRIGKGVTLRVTGVTCDWLRIRSNTGLAGLPNNRASFSVLDSVDGAIYIANTKITSWDFTSNTVDATGKNGRAFLRVEGETRMDIISSEIAYLGSPDANGSYGISWRNETRDFTGKLTGGATGTVLNSDIHHNYYGFFSYGASGMLIRGNKFRNNDSYGFDPHDFSFSFIVEDNEAFDNGNHGFIISRGCYDFIIRRNKSYRNFYRVDASTTRAHGFMIDPGGLTSTGGEYTPSYYNVFDSNEAYENQGYGLRLLDGNLNLIINNTFRNNLRGITIERDSKNNTLIGNKIINNADIGIQVRGDPENGRGDSSNNFFANNEIVGNPRAGIQLEDRVNGNIFASNTISGSNIGISADFQTRLNRWNKNIIAGNTTAIKLDPGSNRSINPPHSMTVSGLRLSGRAQPFVIVEVYSDDGGQMRFREGSVMADETGAWSFYNSGPWDGSRIVAVVTNYASGSSEPSAPINRP
jgi:parallel beta-helix repeat protein